ncbi:MAG: 30S ribosomal protein S16 [Patescibacteria group bacterium]
MVKIRLSQTGTKNRRQYRIIAIEEGKRRNGRAIEILGAYNPLATPPQLVVERDRIDHWVTLGAQLSPAVKKLIHTRA